MTGRQPLTKSTFIEFAKSLEYNQQKTLSRFTVTTDAGRENARQSLRQLQQQMKKLDCINVSVTSGCRYAGK